MAFFILFVIFFFAKPKSPIFTTFLLNIIFAGFKSLNISQTTDAQFLLLLMPWTHYKFVSKCPWLLPHLCFDCFKYTFTGQSRKSPEWCSNYDCFPWHPTLSQHFQTSITAKSESMKRVLPSNTRHDQLNRLRFTRFFFQNLYCTFHFSIVLSAAIDLDIKKATLPYDPFPKTSFM